MTNCIVTVEEHGPGGLGTIVSEILVQRRRAIAFRPVCLSAPPPKVAGSQAYLRAQYGLTVNHIVDVTLEAMKQKAS